MSILVDEADNEGNTPLHLLAASGDNVPQMILDHPSAKKMAFNKQNQTPLDIALSRTWTTKKVLPLVRDGFPSLLWTDSVRRFF
ncbi:hypothetical protein KY285_031430 [Solanum tuberosum]|nr:hypothetical protein KY284_031218 [Solanum tuberosum]KAH0656548.1 hypothetical protein KY285_031430 [Solanum tuberosum]